MKNYFLRAALWGAMVLSSVSQVEASVLGIELDSVGVRVATFDADSNFAGKDFLQLYQPVTHVIGTQTVLIPVDPRIAPATLTSTESTVSGVRTLRYLLVTDDGGALAEASVFFDLEPGTRAALGFSIRRPTFVTDPDTLIAGSASSVQRLLGLEGEILDERTLSDRTNLVVGVTFFDNNNNNSLGPNFRGGTPTGLEVIYTYDVVPEPLSLSLLALGGLALIRKRRLS